MKEYELKNLGKLGIGGKSCHKALKTQNTTR